MNTGLDSSTREKGTGDRERFDQTLYHWTARRDTVVGTATILATWLDLD